MDADATEFDFIGGAGQQGAYLKGFKRAFDGAGLSGTRVEHVYDGDHDNWPGVVRDLATLPFHNDASYASRLAAKPAIAADAARSREIHNAGQQYNIGGYSYGSAEAAARALAIANNGGKVDNLVLVGAPINKDLYDQVRHNPNIGQVVDVDLSKYGDPIHPGMTDGEMRNQIPTLVQQMQPKAGHFYYSGDNAVGDQRRNALAHELARRGLR